MCLPYLTEGSHFSQTEISCLDFRNSVDQFVLSLPTSNIESLCTFVMIDNLPLPSVAFMVCLVFMVREMINDVIGNDL